MVDVQASYKRNRMMNAHNMYQGDYKRVLCVCSAGLLRSPTAAVVLSQPPFGFNTRAAGLVPEYALILVDEVLLEWAQEIVCMTEEQRDQLMTMTKKPVVCLDIEDSFEYRNGELIDLIKRRYHPSEPVMEGFPVKEIQS